MARGGSYPQLPPKLSTGSRQPSSDPGYELRSDPQIPKFLNVGGQLYNYLVRKGNQMSSPITCDMCGDYQAQEAAVFMDGSIMALCSYCLEKAEEFIVNTGCLAD